MFSKLILTAFFNSIYKTYSNFIETGTCYGSTIFSVEPYFEKLYTIEIKEAFYNDVKKNINNTNKKCIKIEQYDLNNNYIKTFNSINSAAKEVGITQMMINRASSNEQKYSQYKTAKGFIWKRKE